MVMKVARKSKTVMHECPTSKLAKAIKEAAASTAQNEEGGELGKVELPASSKSQRKTVMKKPAAAASKGAAKAAEAEEALDEVDKAEQGAPRKVLRKPAAQVHGGASKTVEVEQAMVKKRPAAAMYDMAQDVEEVDEEEENDEEEDDDEEEEEAPVTKKRPAAAIAKEAPVKEVVETATETAGAAQPKTPKGPKPLSKTQVLINAVHRIIASIPYKAAPVPGVHLHPTALTTIDSEGFPSTRTVFPEYVADDLSEVRISSQAGTRKEAEIEANPKVSVHFQDQKGRGGWVTLKGPAKTRPGAREGSMDVVLRVERCEVMSYTEGVMGDSDGWKPAVMVRQNGEFWRRTH